MADFRANNHEIARLANGPEMTRLVLEVADKGKAFAESIAPRRTDLYAASFDVEVDHVPYGRYRNVRVVARLRNTVGYAAAVEFGNSRNGGRGQRILGRTLAALRGL